MPGHLSLWIKAWDTWVSIGERLVVQRVPSPKEISTLLQSHKSESLNAMCSVVPSQTLLVSFLEVLLKVHMLLLLCLCMCVDSSFLPSPLLLLPSCSFSYPLPYPLPLSPLPISLPTFPSLSPSLPPPLPSPSFLPY